MIKTWTSGAIELLEHAEGHIQFDTAFDKRIAFISIDNAVEIIIKTYLSLPKQFFGNDKPSRKEIDDCNNSFTLYLLLLYKNAKTKLVGIDPGDIEHYHRIRNTLYHDGTGLGVDQEYLNAYFTIANLLLKRLFNVELQEPHEVESLEKLIINWNHIEEFLNEIFESRLIDAGTFKWEEAIYKGLLTVEMVQEVTQLRLLRNQIVHSKSIDNLLLKSTFQKSKSVLKDLEKVVELKREMIKNRNFFYEPSVSEIQGKLTFNSFYGPPNYGETPEIDMLERVWILNLDILINVHQVKSRLSEGEFNSTLYNIDRIQLSNARDRINLSEYENRIIKIKGTLWEANTGHHFTPVLMDVISLSEE